LDDDNANFVKEIYKKHLNREPDMKAFSLILTN